MPIKILFVMTYFMVIKTVAAHTCAEGLEHVDLPHECRGIAVSVPEPSNLMLFGGGLAILMIIKYIQKWK